MKKIHFLFFPLLMVLTLFFSCGKKEPTTTYTIGIDKSFFPLNLMGQGNNVYGYTYELFTSFAEQKDLAISILPLNWDATMETLKEKKVDAIVTSMKPYLFYQKEFDFSSPFLATGPVLIENKEAPTRLGADLNGKIIGIISNSENAALIDQYANSTIMTFSSPPELLNSLEEGEIDAALLEALVASSYCRDLYRDKFKIVSKELTDDGLRIICLKEMHPDLIKLFNKTLEEMKKNGKLEALATKWNVEVSCPHKESK